ncbi:MAG: DNA-3-methyladenine glycosylase family protein [Gaiellaceae bacterium]
MGVLAELKPRGPYSLRLSARGANDATRRWDRERLTACLAVEGRHELAEAWQRRDGAVCVRAASEAGLQRMRFTLAVDDDHSEFVRQFRNDPMLGRTIRELPGYRPIRVGSVCQAVLRALAGQLIQARLARSIERRIVRAVSPLEGPFAAPPTAQAVLLRSPAMLRRDGLSARKAATLVRLCRSLRLEDLRAHDGDALAARLERERGFGPWSVGVVFMEGIGRFDRGLVGDLALVKLLAAMRGRWVEGWETAELLEPYGEWAGLASVYMMTGWGRGLLPVPQDTWRRLRDAEARLAAA